MAQQKRHAHGWGRRDTVFVALIMVFGILAAAAGVALATHATGKFELDGNTADSPVGGADDWDNVYKSVTGLGSAAPSSALAQTFVDDAGEPDYSTFGSSNKDFQPASAWQCNSDNNPQNKTNVMAAYAALYEVGGELRLFFGSDREVNTGDANFGFWFFQKPVGCVPADQGGTGRFTGHKTHGDLFIVSEFTNGGRISAVKVYQWTDPTPQSPESGDECLGNGVDCSPANSGEDHPLAAGVDCQDPDPDGANPDVCATVNTDTVTAAWRANGIAPRQLFEGGVNLSRLVGPQINGRCFGAFMAETRSSQEFEADLKDFVLGELDTCTQITIRKQAIGGDAQFPFQVTAGALDPGAFALASGAEQLFVQVPAGSYAIAELVPAGWDLTDIQCQTSGGSTSVSKNLPGAAVTITAGLAGTVDCTFTNTKRPTLTVVKQVQNQWGGTLTAADFTLRVDGQAVSSGVATVVTAGSHVVSEDTVPAGYVQVGITGDCDAAGNVTLAAGESKTCIVTNRDVAPRLTVIKQVVNDNGGTKGPGDFTMLVSGTDVSQPSFAGSAAGVTVSLRAGTYGVDEQPAAGYAKTLDAGCAGTIALGETRTCTIVNDDIAPRLTVIKQVVNDDGGAATAADFTMVVTAQGASPSSFPGSEAGTSVTLAPGSFSVGETGGPAGYVQTSAVGCTGTIAVGESRTCTIVNDDVAPRLTVIKQVVNNNGGAKTAADFTMLVSGSAVSQPSFAGSAAGVTVTLKAGSYEVTETGPTGYTQVSAVGCAGTIGIGESRTCTLVNDDVATQLIVVKQVINDHGGTAAASDFTMQVSATGASPASFPGSPAGVTVSVLPGAYSVTETGPAGYALVSAEGCAGTIAAGETRTCTLVNDDIAPRLTVIKQVVNDHGGTMTPADFSMQVTTAGGSIAPFPGSDTGVTLTLAAGGYAVGESGPAGYTLVSSIGCSGTLAIGETRTCTLVNDDVAPRLTVIKHVVNDSGGKAVAGDFTMFVTGTGVSQPSFPGSETGTTVTLKAGAYAVDEILTPGYEKELGAGCSGTIAVGETRTCIVTNTDLPLVAELPFCDDAGVQALLDPLTGRFPGNLGPDVVVDGISAPIQAAIDNATDVNGDGYVIVGLVAKAGAGGIYSYPFAGGGKVNQSLRIGRTYAKPFALVGCQVVLHDPLVCDGISPATITAGAGSPEHPAGSGARLFVYGVGAEGSESSPAWLIQGDGRHVEEISGNASVVGIKVQGNKNVVRDAKAIDNWVDSLVVEGNDNVVDGAYVMGGSGDGVKVTGHRNRVMGSAIGDQGQGNHGTGIVVSGRGNQVLNNAVYSNGGHGISVAGGTAAGPNVVKGNAVGAPYRGNAGHGIVVAGLGSGTTNPIEIQANTVQSNGGAGLKVTGTGHQLKGNLSGGGGFKNNTGCEFEVAAGNWNATGNKSGGILITGSNGSPFPTGCR